MLQFVRPPPPAPQFITGPRGAPPPTLEGAKVLFAAWSSSMAKTEKKLRGLNTDSVSHYRTHWNKWVAWITVQGVPWTEVTATMVTRYLAQVPRRATVRRQETDSEDKQASEVTQRRYWRLLRDVYRHAMVMDWTNTNPCDTAQEVPRSEDMDSMILTPSILNMLQTGIVNAHDKRDKHTWQQIRDDALVLLVLHTALKTSEIQQLRQDHLWHGRSQTHGLHYKLTIEGQREVQKRELPVLDVDLARIFQLWLDERKKVKGCPTWIFFGQKTEAEGGVKLRSQLTAKTVFLIISKAIATHVPANAFESSLAHVGGECLRNSVISKWIGNNISLEEVKERAGVAELRAIARLDRSAK